MSGFSSSGLKLDFFNFAMNKVNIDWLILHMVDLYQNKTIKNLIVSALRSQQVQVELGDSINIAYGIFQILDTENVPVTQIILCLAILLKKKGEVLSPTLSKSQKLLVPGPKVKNFFQIL